MCQNTLDQAAMDHDTAALKAIFDLRQQELDRKGEIADARLNRFRESQERAGKRARMMDNSSYDTDVSARVVFPNHNNMPVQQNSHIGAQFPGAYLAYGDFPVQNNMGAAYPGPIADHYGAQTNANFSVDYNAAPINCRGATGPGLVQNNTDPFMGHGPAQMNYGFFTGGGGVQKRKFAYM